jgi:hypothetical protein
MGERPSGVRALLLAGLGLVAGILFLGSAQHLAFLRHLASNPAYLYDWTANLSLRATSHRLLVGLPHASLLADGLTLALALTLLVVFGRSIPRSVPADSRSLDWSWGLGVTAVLLLTPLMSEHHLVVLLFPLCLLLRSEPDAPLPRWDQILLVTGVLLLASRYSLERFPAFHAGALSLLTTGKLLGVAVLAWILVQRLKPLDGQNYET